MSDKSSGKEVAPVWGLGDDFGNLFEGFFRPMRAGAPGASAGSSGGMPAADIIEKETEFVVNLDIPGVNKDDIDISVDGDVLTINAKTETSSEQKDEVGRLMRQERFVGKYVRSMRLGGIVDEARIKATYKNGVLNLVLPKVEKAKPKKISVDIH